MRSLISDSYFACWPFLTVPRCSCLHLQQRALNSPRHCPAQLSLLPRTSHRRSRVRWHWWTVFLLWTWPAPPALHPPSVNLNAAVAQMTPAKQSTVQWVLLSPKWHLQNNPQFSEHCCHSNDTCKTIHSSISPVVTQMTPAKQSTVQWALLSPKWHLQNNPQFSEHCCHSNDTCKTIHSFVSAVVTQMTKQSTVQWTLLSPKWHLQNNSQFRQPCCHPNDTCKTIHSSVSPVVTQMTPAKQSTVPSALLAEITTKRKSELFRHSTAKEQWADICWQTCELCWFWAHPQVSSRKNVVIHQDVNTVNRNTQTL